MGCGESKHEVVTGNTIPSQKKSDTNTKNSKDIETVRETNTKDNTENSSVPQQPVAENHEDNKKDLGGAVTAAARDDRQDRDENAAAKEGDGDKQIDKGKEGGDVKKQEEAATDRLISHESPSDYLTTRKNEEGIDGIASEGKSGESVYYSSPNHTAGKEHVLNENVNADNAVEEKELVEETKAAKENGEAVNEEKENVVKEAELKTAIDAKVSSPTSEEKNQNAEEEKKDDTPTKDENKSTE